MKTFRFDARSRVALLAAAALAGTTHPASAVQMKPYISQPSQWGTGSAFNYGHAVMASTPYNILSAGGSYTVQCNHPDTVQMTGERAFGNNTWGLDRNSITVTIPEVMPGLQHITGWLKIPDFTTLSCNYRWTAFATEGGYSIGAGGISFQSGNGTAREGGTVNFTMYRPGREDADGGCIP